MFVCCLFDRCAGRARSLCSLPPGGGGWGKNCLASARQYPFASCDENSRSHIFADRKNYCGKIPREAKIWAEMFAQEFGDWPQRRGDRRSSSPSSAQVLTQRERRNQSHAEELLRPTSDEPQAPPSSAHSLFGEVPLTAQASDAGREEEIC
jgi:hypothetical protein